MQIHTFGDSHSLWGWDASGLPGLRIHHLGAKLCYTFGRDPGIADLAAAGVRAGDLAVFSFGEIDCRCHVRRRAEATPGGYRAVIGGLVEGYRQAAEAAAARVPGARIGLYGVVPPPRRASVRECPNFPFVGSDDERLAYARYFNEQLRAVCADAGWLFIDIYAACADADGFLDHALSDGYVHVRDGAALRAAAGAALAAAGVAAAAADGADAAALADPRPPFSATHAAVPVDDGDAVVHTRHLAPDRVRLEAVRVGGGAERGALQVALLRAAGDAGAEVCRVAVAPGAPAEVDLAGRPHSEPAAPRPHRFPRRVLMTFPTGAGPAGAYHAGPGRAGRALWRALNPGWELRECDDAAARALVAEACPEALAAYDALRPGSFKADLWRYCALWALGGVYVDAKSLPLLPLDCLLPAVADLTVPREHYGLQIAFMAAVPGHPLLRRAIDAVCRNVAARAYGESPFDITGPQLFMRCARAEVGDVPARGDFRAGGLAVHGWFGGLPSNQMWYVFSGGLPRVRYDTDLYNSCQRHGAQYFANAWAARRVYAGEEGAPARTAAPAGSRRAAMPGRRAAAALGAPNGVPAAIGGAAAPAAGRGAPAAAPRRVPARRR